MNRQIGEQLAARRREAAIAKQFQIPQGTVSR